MLRFVEVERLEGTRIAQMACGGAHSAAIDADGALYTWGKNLNGQLGHGHTATVQEPTVVEALPRRVAWVSCGGAHTAVLVRPADSDEAARDRRALADEEEAEEEAEEPTRGGRARGSGARSRASEAAHASRLSRFWSK